MKRMTAGAALALRAGANNAAQWQVEVRNPTSGQTFTPILVAAHYGDSGLPGVDAAATDAPAVLAAGFVHVRNGFHDLGIGGDRPAQVQLPVHHS